MCTAETLELNTTRRYLNTFSDRRRRSFQFGNLKNHLILCNAIMCEQVKQIHDIFFNLFRSFLSSFFRGFRSFSHFVFGAFLCIY